MRWYASLSRAGDIVRLRRRGQQLALGTLSAYWLVGDGGPSRVAVTVSKAVGPAVLRNLLRRRIQGALDGAPPPHRAAKMVFVVRPAAAHVPYRRLAADVAATLQRLSAA